MPDRFNPLRIQPPADMRGNVLAGPDWSGAVTATSDAAQQWLADQRAKGVAAGYIDPTTGWPTELGWQASGRTIATGLGPSDIGLAGGLLGTIRGYHGSPHLFAPTPKNPLGQFDPAKIGTGEGNQAFGVGAAYIAENEGVGRGYRDRLSGQAGPVPGASDYTPQFAVNGTYPPTGMAGHTAMDTAIDLHGLMSYMDMYLNKPSMSAFWKPGDPIHPDFDMRPSYARSIGYLKDQIEGRIDRFRSQLGDEGPSGMADRDMAALADYYDTHMKDATPYDITKRPPGHMYEVNINAEPEDFLHLDKPLSEQSPQVLEGLKKAGAADFMLAPSGGWAAGTPALQVLKRARSSGYHAADLFNRGGDPIELSDADISQRLHEAGIPGFRYLDEGSRSNPNAPDATHNYVVFDPNKMDIIRRYGIAGLMGGGAAAAGQDQPPPNQ